MIILTALFRPPLYTVPHTRLQPPLLACWVVSGRAAAAVNRAQHGCPGHAALLQEPRKAPRAAPRSVLLARGSARAVQGATLRSPPPKIPKQKQDKKPQQLGAAAGYSLKSSFYRSCLIFFNKSLLLK